jgi:myo-inositol-1(or 4)-monophosphatase
MKTSINSVMYEFLAETLARAGQELSTRRGTKLDVRFKADASLVTEADLASEKVIIERIQRHFPDDLIYSEEAGLSAAGRPEGGHIWVVDPLDGTTNYANGYPFYCVSIGRGRFRRDGTIEILSCGILDGARDRVYYAGLGEGAYLDGKPIQVAAARDLAKCFLVTGFYYMKGDDLEREITRFARVAQSCQSIRRDGAAALDLAFVAEGIYDAFWEVGLQPWDVAAGTLLVAEAGGRVRNYDANAPGPYDIEGVGVVAGSPSAVSQVASLL